MDHTTSNFTCFFIVISSTIGNNPFSLYNRQLLSCVNVNITDNNKTFTPHNEPLCYCVFSTGLYRIKTCWWGDACLSNGVTSTLNLPRADGNGYCDQAAPPGTFGFCNNFEPDGYTDVSYTPPLLVPCIVSPYLDPTFTFPSIAIFPPVNPPATEAPYYYLHPPIWDCNVVPSPRLSSKKNIESDFYVYPIPSSNYVHVVNAQVGENVYIYNIMGKVVQHYLIESEDHIINMQNLPTGVYYIKSNFDQNTAKIIKTHN